MSSDPLNTSRLEPTDALPLCEAEGEGLRQFDGYETVGVLGIGGMGVVYKARQTALNRLVAIKTLRKLSDVTLGDTERFRFEAEIVAQFQHPNIVQLYHIGEQNGQPFLVFEYVDGGSLSKRLDGKQQPPRDAAQLIETLARAVHSAHLRGVVHRDLTPNNVLLTKDGTPKIADFGLARMQERSGISSDSIAGTACYMAPEQAWGDIQGKSVGPLTDIYGLGAILYELLCGRPPFKSSTSQKTLLMVYNDPPPLPRSVFPAIPRDLEAICVKCLQKDPHERFESMEALANDLQRFLKGEPIRSRSVGKYERMLLWSRRNPIVASLALALALVAITSFAVVTAEMLAARRAEAAERQRADELDAALYRNQFLLARYAFDSAEVARATKILEACNTKRRSFEWYYLYERCMGTREALPWRGEPIDRIVCSPQGRHIAVIESPAHLKLIDTAKKKLWHELRGFETQLAPPVFGADGRTIAAVGWSDRESWIRIWNTDTAQELTKIGPVSAGAAIHFLPVSDEICSVGIDYSPFAATPEAPLVLEFWNLKSGKRNRKLVLVEADPIDRFASVEAAFSQNGEYVAVVAQQVIMPGSKNGQRIQIFETKSGQRVQILFQSTHLFNARFVFSPDSQHLASFGDEGDATMWDIRSGKQTSALKSGTQPILAAAFSSDGNFIATGGADSAITLYDAQSGLQLRRLDGQPGTVRSLAFSADDATLFSSDANGSLSSWSLDMPTIATLSENVSITGLGFISSQGAVVFTTLDAKLREWEPRSSDKSQVISSAALSLAVSPDQSQLATVSAAGELLLRNANAATFEKVLGLPVLSNKGAKPLAFRPGGTELACIASDRSEVLIINVAEKKLQTRIASSEGEFTCIAFVSAGQLLAMGTDSKRISLWDMRINTLAGQIDTDFAVWDLASRPHSDDIAAIVMEAKAVQIWNSQTHKRRLTIENHQFGMRCLTFTPDGKRLITGGSDRLVKISDADSGQELLALSEAGNAIHYVAVNQAGNRLAAAAGLSLIDGRIVVWTSE